MIAINRAMRSTLPLTILVTPIELHHFGVWFITDWHDLHCLAVIGDADSIRVAITDCLTEPLP